MSALIAESPVTGRVKIDIGAVVANWRSLAAKSSPSQCAAVVKADAYGLGLSQVGPALWRAGARTFFVARLAEGVAARQILPEADIFVLDGLTPGAGALYRDHRLYPCLASLDEVSEWRAAGFSMSKAALHVDTGMNRLGLNMDELGDATEIMHGSPALLMSHFTSSEIPEHEDNGLQRRRFHEAAQFFGQAPTSLSNSSGIFLRPRVPENLSRPGIALYGGNPTPDQPNPMRVAVTLESMILRVRKVRAGERVGYNGVWRAQRDSIIVILGAGYADGLPRSAGASFERAGAQVAIGSVACPIVGRVSMDLMAADATDAPPECVQRGAYAELFGPTIAIDDFACASGVITYDLLTKLGRRYQRIYTRE